MYSKMPVSPVSVLDVEDEKEILQSVVNEKPLWQHGGSGKLFGKEEVKKQSFNLCCQTEEAVNCLEQKRKDTVLEGESTCEFCFATEEVCHFVTLLFETKAALCFKYETSTLTPAVRKIPNFAREDKI